MKYKVVVKCVIVKTMEIEAIDEQEAFETAHQTFSIEPDGCEEKYEQDVLRVEPIR